MGQLQHESCKYNELCEPICMENGESLEGLKPFMGVSDIEHSYGCECFNFETQTTTIRKINTT